MKTLIFIIFLLIFYSSHLYTQTRRALLIGVNKYNPDNAEIVRFSNLEGCENDVRMIKEIIKQPRFGFRDEYIKELLSSEATRDNIISEINRLGESAIDGDILFIYYSGHGSQRKNSLSNEPDKMDEAIVPADHYLGAEYIRDKEIRNLLDNILLKNVNLTVIFDCCHSGSGARGLQKPGRPKFIEPDFSDIADGSQAPAPEDNPNVIILSAAQDWELAREKTIPDDDGFIHSVFTSALNKALTSSLLNESAERLFSRVKSIIEAWGYVQSPVLAGTKKRITMSLFGQEVEKYQGKIITSVIKSLGNNIYEINGGFALGLNEKSELVRFTENTNSDTTRLRIIKISDINRCEAELIFGNSEDINTGDLFYLDKKAFGGLSNIKLYVPKSSFTYEELLKTSLMFKNFKTVYNPEEDSHSIHIFFGDNKWIAQRNDGVNIDIGQEINSETLNNQLIKDKKLFIDFPPTKELYESLKETFKEDLSVEMTSKLDEANYFLTGRLNNGKLEYRWSLPCASIQDLDSSITIPIKSEWVELNNNSNSVLKVTAKVTDSAFKLSKIIGWNMLANDPPQDLDNYPYRLAFIDSLTGNFITKGPVVQKQWIKLVLLKENIYNSEIVLKPRYIYVFAIDVNGRQGLLYPINKNQGSVENFFPSKNLIDSIQLGRFYIDTPFGNDNYFLLTTSNPIDNPQSLFNIEGIERDGSKGNMGNDPLTRLLSSVGMKSRSGSMIAPGHWSIEKITLRSVEK